MKKEIFGQIDNQTVYKYTIQNDKLCVCLLNYGGIIQHISYPDINNHWDNVVLNYEEFESYKENPFYFGCVVGRIAGRTSPFTINDKTYTLPKNNHHHLHGGFRGLDKRLWTEISFSDDTIILTYHSPHLEEGYPGDLDITLKYQLVENSLHWSVQAISSEDTAFNVTNHSYFNLSGGKTSGINQTLQINSDSFMELDSTMLPTGKLIPVEGTPFDFRKLKNISQDIENSHPQIDIGQGYDHPFIIDNSMPIILRDDISHRELNITTNQNACVFYSGNFLDFDRRSAICLETQAPSNGINIPEYRDLVLLKQAQSYKHENIWTFSTF